MKFCDGGSSYCKIYDSEKNDYSIIPTKKLASGDGYWFDYGTGYLIKKKSDKFINQLQARVTGTVKMKLYKGNVVCAGRKSKNSLYKKKLATYDKDDVFDHKAAEGFIKIWGLPYTT